MNPYYLSAIEDIAGKIKEKKILQAQQSLQQELSMPYIEPDAKEALERLEAEIQSLLPEKRPDDSEQTLMKMIGGSLREKEGALARMRRLSLRLYPQLVRTFLESSAPDLLKGQLIEMLMEQKIDEEYVLEKDGLEIRFIPSLIVSADEDPGIQQARACLDAWLSADRPDLLLFAQSLLEQEILSARPFDFVQEDGKQLALSLVRLVYEALQDGEGYRAFLKEQQILPAETCRLYIEKRGEEQ